MNNDPNQLQNDPNQVQNTQVPFSDDPNPFADYSSGVEEPAAPIEDFNPFLSQEVQQPVEEEKPKKKGGLFSRKKKEEEAPQVTTITLKDVQSMSFPTAEQEVPQQVPVMPETFVDPEEARNRRKKIFKRVKKIVELVIIVGLIFFGYTKYKSYSSVVDQKLSYQYGDDIFELSRVKKTFHVNHLVKSCDAENNCVENSVDEYDVKLEGFNNFLASIYFDYSFKFKNGNKKVSKSDVTGFLASKAVYGLINNDPDFLGFFNEYNDYTIMSKEQKSDYVLRGYHYEERSGHYCLAIALGKKDSNGYDIDLVEVHERDGVILIYIKETIPTKKDQWIKETQPVINLEFNEPLKDFKVINVNNKEEFIGY